jgi:hypothetical protein
VTEEFLDGADVGAVFEQVGGEGVAEGVTADALRDARVLHGSFDGALDRGLVEMMAEAAAGSFIDTDPRGWEYPLPGPFNRRIRIFGGEVAGERRAAEAGGPIGFEDPMDVDEVLAQAALDDARQRRGAVASALGFAEHDLLAFEVEVLDAQPQRLEEPQAAAVEKCHDETVDARKLDEDGADFSAREHHRQSLGPPRADGAVESLEFAAEDVAVQEQDAGECLVLR